VSLHYAVGIGANLGDREATFARAAALLTDDGQIRITARSAAIRSAPMGGPDGQEWFLNAVWILATGLGPHNLLQRLQAVEAECGRVRTVRWGPRTLDLDLLLRADGLQVASPVLTLPHPRLAERPFVTEPLAELVGRGAWPSRLS
jgi:2-amino-4-hydroxy-6-hydroxymethyldihydropteridine diphosphokinase